MISLARQRPDACLTYLGQLEVSQQLRNRAATTESISHIDFRGRTWLRLTSTASIDQPRRNGRRVQLKFFEALRRLLKHRMTYGKANQRLLKCGMRVETLLSHSILGRANLLLAC